MIDCRNLKKPQAAFLASHALPSSVNINWESTARKYIIQVSETEVAYLEALSIFILAAAIKQEPLIAIVTPEQRIFIQEQLALEGFSKPGGKCPANISFLDASQTLSRVVIQGRPDSCLFAQLFDSFRADTKHGHLPLRIFDDMAVLLMNAHNVEGAIELERLWGSWTKSNNFVLFCLYPIETLKSIAAHRVFSFVDREHSLLAPAK